MLNIKAPESRVLFSSHVEQENCNNNNDDDTFGYDESALMDHDFDSRFCPRFRQSMPSFDTDVSDTCLYGDGCSQLGDSVDCECDCLESSASSCSRTMVNVSCRAVATPSDCGLGYQYQIIDIKTYPETGLLCCPPGNSPNPLDLDSFCTKVKKPPDFCPSWSRTSVIGSDSYLKKPASSSLGMSGPSVSRPGSRRQRRSVGKISHSRSTEPSSPPPSSSSRTRSSYTRSSDPSSRSRSTNTESQTQSSCSTKSRGVATCDTECQTSSLDLIESKGSGSSDEPKIVASRNGESNLNENNIGSAEEDGGSDNPEPDAPLPEEDVPYDGYSDLDENDQPKNTHSSENIKSAVLDSLQSQLHSKNGSFYKFSRYRDSSSTNRRSSPGLKSLPKYHPSTDTEFVLNEVDYQPMLSFPRFKTLPHKLSSSMSAAAGSLAVCDRHQAKMMTFLRKLYCRKVFTDVSIQVGCSCFNAHRVVLSCFSKFFANRLIQKSCCPLKNTIVLENNISAKTFSAILNFMYTGECQIDRGNLAKMFTAADFLEINSLKARCERLLSSGFREGGSSNKSLQLEQQWQQVARNFGVISRTDQFLNLSPDCIQKLLCRDDLAIDSEMDVAKSAVRWLSFDREKRKKFTRSVMSCIRFKDLWPEELVRLTSTHQSLLADDSIKDAIFEANWYHTCQQRENSGKLSSSLD